MPWPCRAYTPPLLLLLLLLLLLPVRPPAGSGFGFCAKSLCQRPSSTPTGVGTQARRQAEHRPPPPERDSARAVRSAPATKSAKKKFSSLIRPRYSSTNQIWAYISILYLFTCWPPFSSSSPSSSFRLCVWPSVALFRLKTASRGLIALKIFTAGAHGKMEAIIGL
ncbi:hypothetical protein DAPPUDRAFT_105691 [Daphnia pulex]|uniref:Secreted protein n=1 Tax=Daphnia pulex TaxID=6669 RepID=E9GRI1_DAPPU|nr:hypothetical protein DAPPUDRAFT_105691 [Daphnia pulex]|eukprot:EFX77909.1 hypothetical protein DAPPUDRAFT_105691 [Daphnia pulex]